MTETTGPAPLLRVDHLRVTYRGGATAVDDVSFAVAPGEAVAIVGESGSGKSTTALALLGLLPAAAVVEAGDVVWDGAQNLLGAGENDLRLVRGRTIGFIPQDPTVSLDATQRVGAQVAEALAVHGLARGRVAAARAVALLAEAGLGDPERRARQYPHQLSGGMRQRVLIAIAWACRPRLIVADEPTSALDVTVQRQVLDQLDRLRHEQGTSLLLVTHDLAVASDRADRILVMRHGRIVEDGPAERVLREPADAYTRALVAAIPGRGALRLGRSARSLSERSETTGGERSGALRLGRSAPSLRDREGPRSLSERSETKGGDREGARSLSERSETKGGDREGARSLSERSETKGRDREGARSLSERSETKGGPLVEADALVKTYSSTRPDGSRFSFPAVDGVSLALDRGRTLAIVGESGSGKSTTARLVMSLERPTSGRIRFDGIEVAALSGSALRTLRRRFQLIQQNPFSSLSPLWTIERIVAEPLRSFQIGTRATRRARVAELLDRVGLPEAFAARRPHELSGGQRQRVAIARALGLSPDLVVCDEPVSALDVSVQAQILDLLADLQRDLGLAYLFISHDLAVVREIADEVAVMRDGRIVEAGAVDAVFDAPADAYTRRLLDAIPGRAGVL